MRLHHHYPSITLGFLDNNHQSQSNNCVIHFPTMFFVFPMMFFSQVKTVLEGYRFTCRKGTPILNKLEIVRQRGRKRDMFG